VRNRSFLARFCGLLRKTKSVKPLFRRGSSVLDTVEVIGSIPVAPIELFLPIQYFRLIHYPRMLGFISEQIGQICEIVNSQFNDLA
jgi:hypothetical protein